MNSIEIENNILRKSLEEEIEKNKQKDKQLLLQSRYAQMGEMIGMIAHQWRQPLAAISSTSENLICKLEFDDFDSDFFENEIKLITEYTEHLSKTIEDFRGFIKVHKTKKTVKLEDLINQTLEISKVLLANKKITLETNFKCNKLIEIYASEMKQVILNLVKNAEDILLEKNIVNPKITISTLQEENHYVILVQDNAGGVPSDIQDKIFYSSFSTKLDKEGTGLGLYMSKIIIEEHCNGSLSVSNDDNGAVFKIVLYK